MKVSRNIPMTRLLLGITLLALALSWLFSLPVSARYPDLIMERAYYADPEGKEDVQSVQARVFTPFSGPLFRGNDARPLWLRLTLAPSAQPDWVMMFQPNFIHHVEVWLPQPDGGWRLAVTGNRHAYNDREVRLLAPTVALQPAPDRVITVYARVQTPTAPLHVRVLSRDDGTAFDSLIHLVAGAFVGIGLIMSLLSFMVYISTRDTLWGLDVLFNLSGLAMLSIQLGLATRLFWPDSVGWVSELGLMANCVYVAMLSVIYVSLFRLFSLPSWIFLPNLLALLIFPAQLWLISSGAGDLAMRINNAMILVMALWGGLIILKARHPDLLILVVFRITYGGLLAYVVWWFLPIVLRIQTGNLSALYPGLPVSLFTMLMLSLILLRNSQLKVLESQRLAQEKHEAEQGLQLAQQRHEETNSFLGMLLHEVKNPLSTIRMTVINLEGELTGQGESVQRRLRRVLDAVDDVDDVLERGVEVDSLEQGALVVTPALINVSALLSDFLEAHAAAGRLRSALPGVLLVRVDSHLFSLMLRNLIDNAIKYSPEDSLVEVSLVAVEGSWLLEVRNLPGVAGFPDAARVFSKYYRSPLAMSSSGIGLGLYWLHGVARQMGGEAHYMRDDGWVVFRLCLPI